MIFDDGKHRVELRYLGVAHTHGDAFAWLPKQKILFTGDACVNGSFNFVGDGNIEKWIVTIEEAKKLGAKIVCPGHGPRGAETVLNDQQKYFRSLREEVSKLIKAKKSPEQIRDSTEQVQTALKADASIARYAERSTLAHIEKVYEEMTGKKLPAAQKASREARDLHAVAHGHQNDFVMQGAIITVILESFTKSEQPALAPSVKLQPSKASVYHVYDILMNYNHEH